MYTACHLTTIVHVTDHKIETFVGMSVRYSPGTESNGTSNKLQGVTCIHAVITFQVLPPQVL